MFFCQFVRELTAWGLGLLDDMGESSISCNDLKLELRLQLRQRLEKDKGIWNWESVRIQEYIYAIYTTKKEQHDKTMRHNT